MEARKAEYVGKTKNDCTHIIHLRITVCEKKREDIVSLALQSSHMNGVLTFSPICFRFPEVYQLDSSYKVLLFWAFNEIETFSLSYCH